MNTNLLTYIEKNKIPCVILSPHFDDAFLSCGALITRLSGKTSLQIINVFTAAHTDTPTLSARQAIKTAGFKNAVALYKARTAEDKNVFSHFNVTVTNLGIKEALYRKKKNIGLLGRIIPEFAHHYPTYRWHIDGNVTPDDSGIEAVKKAIKKYSNKKTLVFLPSGIGNHVDHKLINAVGTELIDNAVYYVDFPYNVRTKNNGTPKKGQKVYTLQPNLKEKTKMLQLYKTQFYGLFPGGIVPTHKEIYYYSI